MTMTIRIIMLTTLLLMMITMTILMRKMTMLELSQTVLPVPVPALLQRERPRLGEARPPSKLFLQVSYLGVNYSNRVGLKENLRRFLDQRRELEPDPNVSWVGHFIKYEDTGSWPQLFIYSKADRLIPWQFVSEVVEENRRRGRSVSELLLENSAHVAHLKAQPELYTKTLTDFLQCL